MSDAGSPAPEQKPKPEGESSCFIVYCCPDGRVRTIQSARARLTLRREHLEHQDRLDRAQQAEGERFDALSARHQSWAYLSMPFSGARLTSSIERLRRPSWCRCCGYQVSLAWLGDTVDLSLLRCLTMSQVALRWSTYPGGPDGRRSRLGGG
jgi:hypothetical protein